MRAFNSPLDALRFIRTRKQSYSSMPADVIADLAEFCGAYASGFDKDPMVMARLQGRRDVWLRVQEHLKLDADDIYKIATGGAPAPQEREEDHE